MTDGTFAIDTLRRLPCDFRRDRRFCATDPPALLSYTFMAGIFPGATFAIVSFVPCPVRLMLAAVPTAPGTGLFSSRKSDRFACSVLVLFVGVASLRFNHGPDFVAERATNGVTGAFIAEPAPPPTSRERLLLMMEDDLIIDSPPRPGVRPTDEMPSKPFAFFRALEI